MDGADRGGVGPRPGHGQELGSARTPRRACYKNLIDHCGSRESRERGLGAQREGPIGFGAQTKAVAAVVGVEEKDLPFANEDPWVPADEEAGERHSSTNRVRRGKAG